eukprot:7179473-Pyramimonas_sp.AAC.1
MLVKGVQRLSSSTLLAQASTDFGGSGMEQGINGLFHVAPTYLYYMCVVYVSWRALSARPARETIYYKM